MIVEKNGKKYWVDKDNVEYLLEKHEYLLKEEYYESKGIGTGARSSKVCEFCNKSIPKGMPHTMHHFYPEFQAYPTHKECSEPFKLILN